MRILVVEDEVGLANSLATGLKEEGYEVDCAFDGEEAVRLGTSAEYDAYVLDLMIPKIEGFEVCRRYRQHGIKSPILILTALDSTPDKVKGLDSGADDYLTKPFSFVEFLARIRALLRRGPFVAALNLTYHDVQMDLVNHSVRRNGQKIDLTSKEFSLLEYFMRSPERIVTRSELAEHVWEQSFDPLSNVIDVSVSHLRKKLELDGERLLHSVRGLGYTLKMSQKAE